MPTEIPIVASAKRALEVLLEPEGEKKIIMNGSALLKGEKNNIHSLIKEILKVLSPNTQLICYMKLRREKRL